MRTFVCRGPDQLAAAAKAVAGLNPDKPWRIVIAPYRARRSHEQNALLWAIYGEIARETGNDTETIHEAMKARFLDPVVVKLGDEPISVTGSSRKLDVKEFSEFVERVQAFAASELGIIV
jgi:hypothetical protein